MQSTVHLCHISADFPPFSGDYANPLHKEVTRSDSSYYVTEIDPIELGVNMNIGNVEEEVLLSDEFNLNYFGISAANDIVTN